MHVPCTWLECEELVQMETVVSREYLTGKAFLQDTRETFCSARLYYLIHTFCTYTIYTHITHKWEGEPLGENPSKNTWELEIVIPTFLYTFVCEIFSSPTSPFPYIERLIAQTLTTLFQSVKWSFGATGKHWRRIRMADANGACCRIWRTR